MTETALSLPPPPMGHLSPRDFARVAAFIEDRTGIRTPPTKTLLVEGRLRRRARGSGFSSLADYCDHVFADPHALDREAEQLVNALTTNKTDFFREPRHFDYLTATVLPGLVAARVPRVRVWSAGCSTGAEPYTLAMLLEQFCAGRALGYGLLATDIDTEVLDTARRGVFSAAMAAPVPALLRQRYMMAARDGRDEVRMVPELRAAIGFAQLNLMDAPYPVGEPMHVIFCRNVLIYFDQATQERVVRRLLDCLLPGGHLFLGHSESIAGMDLPVDTVASTVFRKG